MNLYICGGIKASSNSNQKINSLLIREREKEACIISF